VNVFLSFVSFFSHVLLVLIPNSHLVYRKKMKVLNWWLIFVNPPWISYKIWLIGGIERCLAVLYDCLTRTDETAQLMNDFITYPEVNHTARLIRYLERNLTVPFHPLSGLDKELSQLSLLRTMRKEQLLPNNWMRSMIDMIEWIC